MKTNHLRFLPREFVEAIELSQIIDEDPRFHVRVRPLSIPDAEVFDYWR